MTARISQNFDGRVFTLSDFGVYISAPKINHKRVYWLGFNINYNEVYFDTE